ncbi:hypothetical protein B0O99DRAFT_625810 [Bisporella sp. PMI_857]|nr:hypothetical protein B0O99DRAFT_625810 [Bisporella sp. PMI_857]
MPLALCTPSFCTICSARTHVLTTDPPPYTSRPHLPLDLETASIRSAAPPYTSYLPPYPSPTQHDGLPPILPPSHSLSRASTLPSLSSFRPPAALPNPTTRQYHAVASRRASVRSTQEQLTLLSAALRGEDAIEALRQRMDAEARERDIRTLEDPWLVGEVAARSAREERLRREEGWGVLEREDRRWDWLLAQMSDWEERDKSWKRFRQRVEGVKRSRLAKRFGMRREGGRTG